MKRGGWAVAGSPVRPGIESALPLANFTVLSVANRRGYGDIAVLVMMAGATD